MARKRIQFDKFYGGMTTDPNVGQDGSFYDGNGIEIRKNSKHIRLAPNYKSLDSVLNSRANGMIIGSIFQSTSSNVLASRDGYLSNILFGESIYGNKYVDSTYNTFYNLFQYYGDVDYGVVIASNAILRWPISNGVDYLGIVENSVVTNGDFSSATGWTVGANWSISGGLATHIAGSTATLSQTLTVSNTTKYIVNVGCSIVSAGSVTVSMGGSNLGTITTSNYGTAQTWARTTASTSEALTFTPTTDFVGSIEFVTVQKSNVTAAVTGVNFNDQCPILTIPNVIYIGYNNTVVSIDTATSSWVSSVALTIQAGFVIKGFSKIGDQIFIYATDGSVTKQYLWDGVSTVTARSITWFDKPLQRVISWNNIDYLIIKTQNRASLWMVNGYQPEIMHQSDFIHDDLDKFAFNSSYINSIETIGTKFLFSGSGNYIYTYGKYTPGLPNGIVREYEYEGGLITNMYYAESAGYNLYYFYSSSKSGSLKNYGVAQYLDDLATSTSLYSITNPGGFITTPIYGTAFGQKKQMVKMRVGYSFVESTNKINVYEKINEGGKYANFYCSGSVQAITTRPTVGAVYTNGGNTYTVTAVTIVSSASGNPCIVHCTYTGTSAVSLSGTLTKSSGTGDATIKFYKSLPNFQLINTLSDNTRDFLTFNNQVSFHKIQFAFDLITGNSFYTPYIYDIMAIFEETNTDIT